MSDDQRVDSARRTRQADRVVFVVMALVTAWVYLSGARLATGGFTSPTPPNYYGLLTEALISGQLNLKITPDPRLAKLTDPYAGPQGVPRPHDMSYFKGKFYLYYGVTPAVVLFVPWRLITGNYLQEIAGTALFCLGGFVMSAWWLFRIKRRLFPALAPHWFALALLLLAFGSPVFFLANNPTFYAVPISAAFFCLIASVAAADRALLAERTAAQAGWLAVASLWLGLSVGARPIYVLGLPMLAIPTGLLWWQQRADSRLKWPALRLWLAAVGPAALVGMMLAAYNYARFGSPFDFGIQWSLGGSSVRGMRLIGTEFIAKNLRLYLITTAEYIRYYPFLYTNGRPFGVLPHLPLVAVALLLPLTCLRVSLRRDRAWVGGGALVLGASIANLAMLSLFFGGEDRYLVDFAPGLLLAAAATLLAVMAPEAGFSIALRRAVGVALLAVASFTLFNGVFLAIPGRADASGRVWLERLLNRPAQAWEQLSGTQHGSLELDLRFPSGLVGQNDPLVTTGNLRNTGDIVYVRYEDSEHVRLGFFHVGAGGPISEPVKIDFTRPHHISIRAGSLLPPPGHPLFSGMTPKQISYERRQLEIKLDGQRVLSCTASFYPSTPDRINIGSNPLTGAATGPRFRGEIISSLRQSWSPSAIVTSAATGPVRLHLRFPNGHPGVSEPLVATGKPGQGDLFFVNYLGSDRVRFGHDNFGGGGQFTSREVAVDFSRMHELEVELGSLYPSSDPKLSDFPPGTIDRLRQRFSVRLDGTLVVATTQPFSPSAADEVGIGFNTIESTSAEAMFTGTIDQITRLGPPVQAAATDVWGPIRLGVEWPTGLRGVAEPLLVTGSVGAADIVFVKYVDDQHVQFGFDHWGTGGPLSEPIEITSNTTQVVEIDLGSLYPPAGHVAWQTRPTGDRAQRTAHNSVRFNGRIVLSINIAAFPATADEVAVGENYVGASTCRMRFSGQIVKNVRTPW